MTLETIFEWSVNFIGSEKKIDVLSRGRIFQKFLPHKPISHPLLLRCAMKSPWYELYISPIRWNFDNFFAHEKINFLYALLTHVRSVKWILIAFKRLIVALMSFAAVLAATHIEWKRYQSKNPSKLWKVQQNGNCFHRFEVQVRTFLWCIDAHFCETLILDVFRRLEQLTEIWTDISIIDATFEPLDWHDFKLIFTDLFGLV